MTVLLNAHALRIPLPDESVHCVVTSPPYWGLRDYGLPPLVWAGAADCDHAWGDELVTQQRGSVGDHSTLDGGLQAGGAGRLQAAQQGQFCPRCAAWRGCLGLEPTPELYVAHLVQIFREVRRVLRADGTLWLNLGDSYAGSWGNYGARDGNQRSRIAERWHRPAYEDERHGWDSLPPTANVSGLKPKDMVGIPWRVAFALQADGWWLRSDIIWHKPNGMPESVTDRPTKAHEYLFLLAKSERYFYDADAIRESLAESTLLDSRNATGRHTQGKSHSKYFSQESPAGIPHDKPSWYRAKTFVNPAIGRNRRTVWTIPTASYSGAHFATFPPALVKPCIEAGASARGVCPTCGAPWERVVERETGRPASYNGSRFDRGKSRAARERLATVGQGERTAARCMVGWQPTCNCDAGDPVPATVLDPFVGSGTTLLVARTLGRCGVGLDLSFDYLHAQARQRLQLDALAEWYEGRRSGGGNLGYFAAFCPRCQTR